MLITRKSFGDNNTDRMFLDGLFSENRVLDTKSLPLDGYDSIIVLSKLLSGDQSTALIKKIINDAIGSTLLIPTECQNWLSGDLPWIDVGDVKVGPLALSTSIFKYATDSSLRDRSVLLVAKEAVRIIALSASLCANSSFDRNRIITETRDRKFDLYISWIHSVLDDNNPKECAITQELIKEVSSLKDQIKQLKAVIRNIYSISGEFIDE